jgi:hypothetical protein
VRLGVAQASPAGTPRGRALRRNTASFSPGLPLIAIPNGWSLCSSRARLFGSFVVRFPGVDVLPSARRHGVEDADIDHADVDHAVQHAVVVDEVAEDPTRYLVIGPDRAGTSSS